MNARLSGGRVKPQVKDTLVSPGTAVSSICLTKGRFGRFAIPPNSGNLFGIEPLIDTVGLPSPDWFSFSPALFFSGVPTLYEGKTGLWWDFFGSHYAVIT